MDKKAEAGKEGSEAIHEVMKIESEKHLGCVTQEVDYIKTWVMISGKKLARVLCKDMSILRRI